MYLSPQTKHVNVSILLHLTLYLLVSSADNFCKQFGPTKSRASSRSNLFDTPMVFLKEFFQKVDFEKKSADHKKSMKNFPVGRVKIWTFSVHFWGYFQLRKGQSIFSIACDYNIKSVQGF